MCIIDFLVEDLETSSKASNKLKKQEGSYTDLYFNYSINQDLRDRKYRTESGYVKKVSNKKLWLVTFDIFIQ